MRGDRTDRMFDYLPYDRVSGQWQGIHLYSSSTQNSISYADIHSTMDGIVCDSAAFDSITRGCHWPMSPYIIAKVLVCCI